jgi:hypothetical protein
VTALFVAVTTGCAAPLREQPPAPVAPSAEPEPEPEPAGEPSAKELPQLDDAATAALLRGHLLQLLPCDHGKNGQIEFTATIGLYGTLQSLNIESSTVPSDMARCVLSRVAWWRFPPSAKERTEVRFTIDFPLSPPTINDHVAVLTPGGGSVDLSAATHVLRRLRKRVIGCLHGRREPSVMMLLWLQLGEWGKLMDFGIEADTGGASRSEQVQERGCLRRVLRLGQFPNPTGGEVTLRFPYVR